MEQDSNPRIPSPSSKNTKQVEGGSFTKRNPWLIVVIVIVILFGLLGWFVVNRVRHAIRRYQAITMRHDTLIKEIDTIYQEAYTPSIKAAKLIIHGGTATYKLSEATDQLFSADAKLHNLHYEVKSYNEYSDHVVDFGIKDKPVEGTFWGKDGQTDSVNFKLNIQPVWDIEVNTGATDLNFDLSKYKMRDVVLKGGAAQFVLKMGAPLATSNINVSTGASDVTIQVPQDAACSIETSSGLSSTDYPSGYIKKDDGHYESANFDAAKTKYYIHISGGVSEFKVHTY